MSQSSRHTTSRDRSILPSEGPEPFANLSLVSEEHAPKPDQRFTMLPPKEFVGKNVKLGFPITGERRPGDPEVEHMWVYVEAHGEKAAKLAGSGKEGELLGQLVNDPLYIRIRRGTMVSFNRCDIEEVQ